MARRAGRGPWLRISGDGAPISVSVFNIEETFDPQNISIVSNFVHTAGTGSASISPALQRTSRCTDRPQLEASMPSENSLRATRKSLPEIWFVLIRLKLARWRLALHRRRRAKLGRVIP
jgi:hypothetical protein